MPMRTAKALCGQSISMWKRYPRRAQVELEAARLNSGNIVHAGDTITG